MASPDVDVCTHAGSHSKGTQAPAWPAQHLGEATLGFCDENDNNKYDKNKHYDYYHYNNNNHQ